MNKRSLRGIIFGGIAAGCLVASSGALAVDKKVESTSDTSRNPLTGTVTETNEYEKEVKTPDGHAGHVKLTEKTKHYKDGDKKKTVDAESSSESR